MKPIHLLSPITPEQTHVKPSAATDVQACDDSVRSSSKDVFHVEDSAKTSDTNVQNDIINLAYSHSANVENHFEKLKSLLDYFHNRVLHVKELEHEMNL